MFTKEEKDRMRKELLESFRPQPPPPKPTPEEKWQERCAAPKPREAIAAQAAASTEALAEQMRQDREQDTTEARRRRQEAKELAQYYAEGQDPRIAYQRRLDQWWEAKLDVEAELHALRGEIPKRGVYDPMARFEREMKEG